jgi:hypothetical protein
VVQANTSITIAAADPTVWNFEGVDCFSGRMWDEDVIKVNDDS